MSKQSFFVFGSEAIHFFRDNIITYPHHRLPSLLWTSIALRIISCPSMARIFLFLYDFPSETEDFKSSNALGIKVELSTVRSEDLSNQMMFFEEILLILTGRLWLTAGAEVSHA